MIVRRVKITDDKGLHLRPAGRISGAAVNFKSRVTFDYADGQGSADAKSVISVLAACVGCGDEITLRCDGPDEKEAMDTLLKIIDGEVYE